MRSSSDIKVRIFKCFVQNASLLVCVLGLQFFLSRPLSQGVINDVTHPFVCLLVSWLLHWSPRRAGPCVGDSPPGAQPSRGAQARAVAYCWIVSGTGHAGGWCGAAGDLQELKSTGQTAEHNNRSRRIICATEYLQSVTPITQILGLKVMLYSKEV